MSSTLHKVTIQDLIRLKQKDEPIVMVTAYDYPTALLADRAGIDVILVGDSIGNNVLGYEHTLQVSMDEMISHSRAVSKATERALIVGDMPYMSYQPSDRDAVLNAGAFMRDAEVDAVKLEGGTAVLSRIKAIIAAGIPVMGHIGLTPQSFSLLGGYRVQGRDSGSALRLLNEALALQDAGIFALVLEAVPAPVAKAITERLEIPTIGIGAGPYCDGQVLVFHDIFGLSQRSLPKFAKRYVDLSKHILKGFCMYKEDVKSRKFPDEEHSYSLSPEELNKFQQALS
ncbi:3-methyl-2-oxobutanoatehydroxymethyltransferase [Thermobaculum terrenum ATCC BAA-798]|uniref:3-methyl-2-oxobutanoate hydroxymethyltransferase n=1 Tax=Thermobaculum terrenum (strain ATCC BAA-798 / CCMEE 7001 / YNP1) TaxID=525904 RepID=D1CBZ3_THET1|nr:3-methyl-2-oxobutanoate hydroxymethyltransferase [Thermobaculum terrenum]ACZ42308.1 3-methyl-2-oxobutanoatehydroxymethyltransferase [Thermobaculum terrenum ATCC BAA-798]